MANVPEAAQTGAPAQQLPTFELPTIQAPMLEEPSIDEATASEWQTSFCDCGSCVICCLGCFAPCYLSGQTAERIRDPTMQTAQAVNMDCLVHGCTALFRLGFLYVALKRMVIRQQFNIRGSPVRDVILSYYCPWCATCQQYNEAKARLEPLATGSAEGYQTNPGMAVPPAMTEAPPTGQNPASN